MHRGIREFIHWVENHGEDEGVRRNPPVTAAELAELEVQLGGALPTDLRLVQTRFNGADLPSGTMLPAGIGPGTIGATVREYAGAVAKDFLNPELLLPFFRTEEGSLLAFDRSAGPVSDTWPIVDFDVETGEHRLVYRTFDGFCRVCVADWTSDDFQQEFGLDQYLRKGRRHAAIEPDVASAHATVAHASKRAGLVGDALAHYLEAARCVPPMPWCDWEALKIAVLVHADDAALEAATRLCAIGPDFAFRRRETAPAKVAEVMGPVARRARDQRAWLRLFDQLLYQTREDPDAQATVAAVRAAVVQRDALPPPMHGRGMSMVPPHPDLDVWWGIVRDAYLQGSVRDEDLLLDPALEPLRETRGFAEILSIRREF